jgi:hypothetical protein
MPSDKRRLRCVVFFRSLVGENPMSLGHRLKVRSSEGFAFMDLSMISGVDRRVSIQTT